MSDVKALQEEVKKLNSAVSDRDAIIDVMKSTLSNLHYDSATIRKDLRAHDLCLRCRISFNECTCCSACYLSEDECECERCSRCDCPMDGECECDRCDRCDKFDDECKCARCSKCEELVDECVC
jgi:hypothetical protein